MAARVAYGNFQARGCESELQLQAYTTATATRDPSRICDLHHSSRQPTEWGQGSNLHPHGHQWGSYPTEPQGELPK